jgi:hypothetical protein
MYTCVGGRVRRCPCVGGGVRAPGNAAPTRRNHPHVAERAPGAEAGAVRGRFEGSAEAAREPATGRVSDQHAATVPLITLDRGLGEVAERHRGRGRDRIRLCRGYYGIAVGTDRVRGIERDRDPAVSGQRPDHQDLKAVAPLRGGRSRQVALALARPFHLQARRPGVGTLSVGTPDHQLRQACAQESRVRSHRTACSTMSKRSLPPLSGASGWLRSKRRSPLKQETPAPAPTSASV